MKYFSFKGLLQDKEWIMPCFAGIDGEGKIGYLSSAKPNTVENFEEVNGYAVPGFQNAHSHAFQYAMAGLAEIHPNPKAADDFWSWRESMYKIALTIAPEQMEDIATMLYAEMLRHGYTSVAEFHYLHHDKKGKPYRNPAEMGSRLVAAAKRAGIKITLIPIFYQKGGFGKAPLPDQRRFISPSMDDYLSLLESSKKVVEAYEGANLGAGIHSLRAVSPEDVLLTVNAAAPSLPFHLHISEQKKEVQDALGFLGKRPVEWLLENVELNNRFHLVHATQMNEQEVKGLARSEANVVLCPSTEGNLGDGLFELQAFQSQGGKWSIGTDSHIGLNPLEELRLLDYGQRLRAHRRNIFVKENDGDAGHFAFNMALKTGRKAMGNQNEKYFAIGHSFDAAVVDADFPLLSVSKKENILATLIFAGDPLAIMGTITGGKWRVKEQKHLLSEEIMNKFRKAITGLAIR